MTTQLVLLSGGLDSSVALGTASEPRIALSVDYGQRHRASELKAAERMAALYEVEHYVLDLTSWGALLPGGSLTDDGVEVPDGMYDAPSMAITVVPNRNATLLMAAVGVAQAHGIDTVVTAVHAGDHTIYADCRPDFIKAARTTAKLATEGAVDVSAPFIKMSKGDIAKLGFKHGVPLYATWSCYKGGATQCGTCGTCTERREAFSDAGISDPTPYLAP